MPARLVALDEGPDIPVDRAMLVVGRHPQCDARLDSIRVSHRHCCMTQDNGEVIVRDLGSTNGIRINGQRVEMGRLRPGDELSIAHIRFRLDHELASADKTFADPPEKAEGNHVPFRALGSDPVVAVMPVPLAPAAVHHHHAGGNGQGQAENNLAAAVRELLPSAVGDRCRIQVIVQVPPDGVSDSAEEAQRVCPPDSSL